MKKKVLPILLAAVMALSLFPSAALAAEDDDCDPIIIGGYGHKGERPPTDPYNDHIDTLAEAAEKGYILFFSEGEDGPIDLGSVEYGYTTPPSKTITVTNKGDKSLYLVSTGTYAVKVTVEGDEFKEQYNLNFSSVPVYELEPGRTYHLNIEAGAGKEAKTHKGTFSLDFSYTYPANHSAMKAWDLTCNFDVTYTVTYDGSMGGGVPLTLSQESLDFLVENGATQSKTITVTNTSDWEVKFRALDLGSNMTINGERRPDEFTLAPGKSLNLVIEAAPKDNWASLHESELILDYSYEVEGGGNWQRHSGDVKVPIRLQTTQGGTITVYLQVESPMGPSGYFTSMDGSTTYWGNEPIEVPAGESLSFKAVPFSAEYGYVLAVERTLAQSATDYEYIGHDDVVTFENVQGVQRIQVSFATSQKPPAAWAHDAVGRAYSLNIFSPREMPGYRGEHGADGAIPTSDFSAPISREDFCGLAAALYNKLVPYHDNPFSSINSYNIDLPTFTDTTNSDVREMAYLGVVNGVSDGVFDPDGELTREQAATILARLANALELELDKAAPTFDDSGSISSWAKEAVGQMQTSGIMGGMGNGQFGPQGTYSWEQSIATIMRIYDMANVK